MKRAIALVVLLSLPALAQSDSKKAEPKKPVPVQKIEFGNGDLIEGGIETPQAEIYSVPPNPKFPCLIKLRANFNDKLRQSVHEM